MSGLTAFLARMTAERLKRRLPDDPPITMSRSQAQVLLEQVITARVGLSAYASTGAVSKARAAMDEARATLEGLLG